MTSWRDQLGGFSANIEHNAMRSLRGYRRVVEDAARACACLAERDHSARHLSAEVAERLNTALLEYLTNLAANGRYRFGDKRYKQRRQPHIEPTTTSGVAEARQVQVSEWLVEVQLSLLRACADAELALLAWLGPDESNCDGSFWSEVETVAQYLGSGLRRADWA